MITIVFAPPRTGKTCFITHAACEAAFDRQRNRAMENELVNKIANGFNKIQTIPSHCIAANYDITMRKFGYSPRLSRRINPYKLGFKNPFVETHFSIPYEFYCITEAQKYFNSRMALYYPDWQSRFFEQHGHNYLDFWLDTQRPMLIDPNIRDLAGFIEIVKLDIKYDLLGQPCRLQWTIRHIPNSQLFDRYMSSGQQDKHCYIEEIVTADYNVFKCYDSRSCKPKFYDGHMDKDIDYAVAEPTEDSLEGYVKFLQKFDDELPDNFYMKRSERNKNDIQKKPLDFNPNQKINYNENDLLDELHARFFQSFAVTLDVADYVPQKYIEKVYKQIYKALKRRYRKISKTNKAYQKWFNAHFIPQKVECQVQPALLQNKEGATNEQEQ